MHRPSPTANLLKASLVPEPPCLFLDLRGELDLSCVGQVPGGAYPDRRDLTTVVIDLGELTFCDLTGLRTLLAFARIHQEQGRTVTVVRAAPIVRRLMHLCGVSDRLTHACPEAAAV